MSGDKLFSSSFWKIKSYYVIKKQMISKGVRKDSWRRASEASQQAKRAGALSNLSKNVLKPWHEEQDLGNRLTFQIWPKLKD